MLGNFSPVVVSQAFHLIIDTIRKAYDSELIPVDQYLGLLRFLESNACQLELDAKLEYDDLLELDQLIALLIARTIDEQSTEE